MNIIFQINGGIGKVIASTAVCASIKTKYPDCKLIVVSGYPDVFLGNPNVDRAYGFGQQAYFYKEYIENQEVLVFAHDPYLETKHIKQEEHLIETWCKLYDLPVTKTVGELFLTKREIDFFSKKFVSDKPILLLQTNGGTESDVKYSWARDIPSYVVENIIHEFKEQYNIVHIRREDQIKYDNTFSVTDTFRALVVLINLSDKRLMMDSFGQHAAAALNKPSTVLWVVNSPKVFGYDIHTNITANPETTSSELRNSYLNKYNISGELIEFPYNNESEIFNVNDVIKSLK
jgi:ADP-heptose:LPS heptosyltransferase